MSIRKVQAGEQPSASHYNQIVDVVNALLTGTTDGIIAVAAGNLTLNIPLLQQRLIRGAGAGASRLAVATSAWTAGQTTGGNLMDSGGSEGTEAITINFLTTYNANNFPAIANDDVVPVFLDISGLWYCPQLFITAETMQVVTDVDTTATKLQANFTPVVKVLDSGTAGGLEDVSGTVCP